MVNVLGSTAVYIGIPVSCREIEHLFGEVRSYMIYSRQFRAKRIQIAFDNANAIHISICKLIGIEVSHDHQSNIWGGILEGLDVLSDMVRLLPAFFFDTACVGAVYSKE